nr:IS3 family transposase [uncultured Leifsonia sp.]
MACRFLNVSISGYHDWATRPSSVRAVADDSKTQLASAVFEWIEGFCNSRRRHSALDYLSPADYEALHTTAEIAA